MVTPSVRGPLCVFDPSSRTDSAAIARPTSPADPPQSSRRSTGNDLSSSRACRLKRASQRGELADLAQRQRAVTPVTLLHIFSRPRARLRLRVAGHVSPICVSPSLRANFDVVCDLRRAASPSLRSDRPSRQWSCLRRSISALPDPAAAGHSKWCNLLTVSAPACPRQPLHPCPVAQLSQPLAAVRRRPIATAPASRGRSASARASAPAAPQLR